MTQFLDTPVDKSPATVNAWVDVDLSSEIPEGATGAIFQIENTSIQYYSFGIRKKGSTYNRWPAISPRASKFAIVGVDSNRKCQVKTAGLVIDLFLVGYTQNDAVLFTNGYDKSQTTTGVWADLDLSTELPEGAVTAIFEIENASTSAKSFGMRKKGSSDNRYGDLGVSYPNMFFIVGVDSNRKCQYKIETSAIKFSLLGYLKAGEAETNGIDRSLGSTGSYIDITESGAPANSSGVFTEFDAISINADFAARKNGSEWDKYCYPQTHKNMIFAGLDSDKKWEGKISNTEMDFYTLGYFSPGVTTDYDFWKKGSVIATAAGAQTDYQLELIVGESSGASGADVHCNGHCQNFPNDIRFIKEDGVTKHDYWIDTDSLTGITPNRKLSVWIEVASIPSSGSVDFYMYYGKVSDSGESDGDNTFAFFDDFDGPVKTDLDDFTKIGLYESSNPVIACGGVSDSDRYIRELGNILYEPAEATRKYKTFYTGYNSGSSTDEKIHYAYSEDGNSWTKSSSNPVISNRRAEDPYVVKNGSTYYLFAEDKEAGGENKIRRWHSSDCESWIDDGQLTGIGDGQSPIVWIEDTTWYILYERYPANADIALATSSNGLAWTDDASNPVMEKTDTNWVTGSIVPDSIIKKGTLYHMFYHALGGSLWKSGHATSTDLTEWTDSSNSPYSSDEPTVERVNPAMIFHDTQDVFLYTGRGSVPEDEAGIYRGYPIKSKWTEETNGVTASISIMDSKARLQATTSGHYANLYSAPIKNAPCALKVLGFNAVAIGNCAIKLNHDGAYPTQNDAAIFSLYDQSAGGGGNSDSRGLIRYGPVPTEEETWRDTNVGDAYNKADLDILVPNTRKVEWKIEGILKGVSANALDDETWRIQLMALGGRGESDVYIDTVLLRNYASPEPTWGTWGAEVPTSQEIVKQSSAGLSISAESETISSAGLSIITRFTKESSAGLNISGSEIKQSSAGLGISEKNIKESSASLSISDRKTKESSAGLHIATLPELESSASLAVKASFVKESSAGLVISAPSIKESSASLSISGVNTLISSAGLFICEPPLKKGLFYGKLGSTILETVMPESFRISKEINRIPSFEFEVANSEVNRTAIAANATALFEIYWQHHGVDTLIFTGIINADGIEYISLSNIRITGFASYAKLGWPLYKHLDSEDAEPVNTVFDFHGTYTDYTTQANNATINDVPITFGEENHCFYVGEANPFWGLHVKYSTKGVIPEGPIFGTNFDIVVANATSSKIETIPASHSASNIFITDLYLEVPALATPTKKIKLELLTERDNVIFSSCDLDASISKSFHFDISSGQMNATKYKITTDANVTGNKTCNVEIRGWAIPENETIIEFSKGNGVWKTLDVLDETNAFTEEPGTYDVIISHPPSDWARNTVNGISKFWIRWRVVSSDYTTSPKLDQIHTVNVDVYRVFYLATSARAILLDVLEDTEYSMDAIDACPEDEINLLAEYESPLRIIAAIPAALTWTDIDGSKKSYQWWIDEAKKVHIKQERGTTYSNDITGDLTIFNNLVDYFNVSNRLIGFSKRDGLSQIRAIVENKASQTTHALREIAVPKNEIGKYLTLKASLEKDIAYSKDPMQRIKGSVTTEFWGQNDYEVGDRVTLHQGEWVVEEGAFQIVKADIGPILTQLNLGISREHLEGLKSNLKRAFDISNVQMHGSTSLLTAGPETSNYERKSDGGVFSAKLKIEIPSEVVKTHKVLLSWTIGPYRASVNEHSSDVPSHSHGGAALVGGALDSGYTGDNGGFTPGIVDGGGFTPSMIGSPHAHLVNDSFTINFSEANRWYPVFWTWEKSLVKNFKHRHTIPSSTTGGPDDTADAVHTIVWNEEYCAACSYWLISSTNELDFALGTHIHDVSSGNTGYDNRNAYIDMEIYNSVTGITPYTFNVASDAECVEGHIHDGVEEPDHGHAGVAESDHGHVTPAITGHTDHGITAESSYSVDMNYGIHEETAGTVLELLINEEKIGEFEGPQIDIRIDGYLQSATNTIEIQPIASELDKKGSAAISASGILFIEPRRF